MISSGSGSSASAMGSERSRAVSDRVVSDRGSKMLHPVQEAVEEGRGGAEDEGLLEEVEGTNVVRIHNTNTSKIVRATVSVVRVDLHRRGGSHGIHELALEATLDSRPASWLAHRLR